MVNSKYLILFLTSFLFILASCTLGGVGGGPPPPADSEPPVITSFIGPAGPVNVPTIDITVDGSDNEGITDWMISFNNTKPAEDDLGWVANNPTTFSLGVPGVYTLYAWARDAAGNVSDENPNSRIDVNAAFNCKEWTILIHFAIDNNIDYSFEEDAGIVSNYLATLETVKANGVDKINILILMDGYNNAANFPDGYYCLTGGAFAGDRVVNKTEINSGSLNDARDFMDWAVANYPAKKYLYSVFNHGSGFDDVAKNGDYAGPRGIAFDDSSSDCLSHYELGQAAAYLKNNKIGGKIELFYAFACLMGGVELAYEVRDSANYLLFSEETFPAEKWSYEALESINTNPDISGGDLGKAFCDSAESYFPNIADPRDFTLSVIDLSKVADLAQAIDTYADLAIADISNNDTSSLYNTAAANSLTFTADVDDYYYVDLGDYLSKITANAADAAVIAQAANVSQALTACVVYKTHNGFASASGMTIYHNIWGSAWYYTTNHYRSLLTFGADNSWTDYIVLMNSKNNSNFLPDAYEPDNSQSQARSISVNGSRQRHTIHNADDFDFMKVVLQAGTSYKIETYPVSGQQQCNTLLIIADSDLNILFLDNNGGIIPYSRIDYICNVTGTYYVYVESLAGLGVYDIDIRTISLNLSNTENMDMDSINKNGNTEKQLEDLKNRLEQLKE